MSLIPSSTITCVTPGCINTSRSKRSSALGPAPGDSTRFPEMPALTIALSGSFDANRRRARTSGQRAFESAFEPTPSVIEFPNVTITPVTAGLTTSIPATQGHVIRVVSGAKLADPVKSPDGDT